MKKLTLSLLTAALLAQGGEVDRVEALLRLLVVAHDLQPRHLASLRAQVLADHGKVVLGVARGHAGAAARAGRRIDADRAHRADREVKAKCAGAADIGATAAGNAGFQKAGRAEMRGAVPGAFRGVGKDRLRTCLGTGTAEGAGATAGIDLRIST